LSLFSVKEKELEIKYALLGFLSWHPFSGYDLKKMMENSDLFYWSGNNNQIYTGLVQLHREGRVESETQPAEKTPNRKIYRITPGGLEALRQWLCSEPELPQLRKTFLIQLAWSHNLSDAALDAMLLKYENELRLKVAVLNEQQKRRTVLNPARSGREKYLWEQINDNILMSYQSDLTWAKKVRQELGESKFG
jgi:PadR family transcriptional regulator, regulatory protein AphA